MTFNSLVLNAGPTEAELLVYGTIGKSWFDDESVDALSVVKQLNALGKGVKSITVRINSFGGSLADGFAIYNALKAHSAHVTAVIDGVAMSAASLIAMSADVIEMPATAIMMIHAPSSGCHGNAVEMRKAAAVLDKFAEAMVTAYTSKSGKSEEDIKALLNGEDHFYTGKEAVSAGFADKLVGDTSATAWSAAVTAIFQAGFTPPKPQETPVPEPIVDNSAAEAVAAIKAELEAFKASHAADLSAAASVRAELDAVRASLAAEVDAKEIRSVVAEVAASYKHLAVKAEDFGPAVRTLRRAAPEAFALIEAALASADALIAQSLDPKGSTASAGASTVQAQLDVLIKAKRTANPKMSVEKAEGLVFDENPALYNALRVEQV